MVREHPSHRAAEGIETICTGPEKTLVWKSDVSRDELKRILAEAKLKGA